MQKFSKQRESILKNLQSRYDHPTAEKLYEDLKKTQPKLSLATVYRNLNLLTDMGTIRRISSGIGPDHFDGFTHPHNHFVCQNCGKIVDMSIDLEDDIVSKVASDFNGQIDGFELSFFGVCEDCLKEEKKINS